VRRLFLLLTALASVTLLNAPSASARMLYDAEVAGGNNLAVATVAMNHLPGWVQVSVASAPLYTADAGSQQVQKLSRYTFLRVLGGGRARLQVEPYNDQSQATQRGFVDAADVLPSAAGTDWRVTSTETALYRSSDASADPARTLARFTPLQQLGAAVDGRIQVSVYNTKFAELDQGWVDLDATGPAFPPDVRVPSSNDGLTIARQPTGDNQPQLFLEAVSAAAQTAQTRTGVPASVTVAQAILESDWGRSTLAQDANNYFGIKATSQLGSDGVVWMPTSEYNSAGELFQTVSPFRAYKTLADSITDHNQLLQGASRYAAAMNAASDPKAFAAKLYEAGYSTDPSYPDKLIALMDRYNLYSLDA
jgi:hypothetical protein